MQPSLRNKSLILNRIAVILKNLKNNKNYVEKIEREREREKLRETEAKRQRKRVRHPANRIELIVPICSIVVPPPELMKIKEFT